MSTNEKAESERWYEEQVANGIHFDMQRDLRVYCISDVKLLRAGCLAFDKSSIGVGGTSTFLKNDLIPTQLHTTFHLMVTNFRSRIFGNLYVFPYYGFIFLISYFRLPIFDLVFLFYYFWKSMCF